MHFDIINHAIIICLKLQVSRPFLFIVIVSFFGILDHCNNKSFLRSISAEVAQCTALYSDCKAGDIQQCPVAVAEWEDQYEKASQAVCLLVSCASEATAHELGFTAPADLGAGSANLERQEVSGKLQG